MSCYVFWIPSLSGKLNLKETEITENISDTEPFLVEAKINSKTRVVVLTYQYKDNDQEVVLKPFKDIDRCFLYYTLASTTEQESPLITDLLEKYPNWLYHIFKKLYHKHKFHSEEEDSILHTRFFQDLEAYEKAETTDREFYLKEYEERFRLILARICDNLAEISKRKDKEYINYLKIYKGYKKLLDIILKYEGELLYCS